MITSKKQMLDVMKNEEHTNIGANKCLRFLEMITETSSLRQYSSSGRNATQSNSPDCFTVVDEILDVKLRFNMLVQRRTNSMFVYNTIKGELCR